MLKEKNYLHIKTKQNRSHLTSKMKLNSRLFGKWGKMYYYESNKILENIYFKIHEGNLYNVQIQTIKKKY